MAQISLRRGGELIDLEQIERDFENVNGGVNSESLETMLSICAFIRDAFREDVYEIDCWTEEENEPHIGFMLGLTGVDISTHRDSATVNLSNELTVEDLQLVRKSLKPIPWQTNASDLAKLLNYVGAAFEASVSVGNSSHNLKTAKKSFMAQFAST